MFSDLNVFKTAAAMAKHAGQRQALTAQNIANADTPGYRAMTMARFQDAVDSPSNLRATRPGHMSSDPMETPARAFRKSEAQSPNGNTVSLELEMLSAVEIQREHSRALAIYKHGLDIVRLSIGRR